MKINNFLIIILIFSCLIIFFSIFNKSIEGFSFMSEKSSNDTQYKYLAPLPIPNTWTQDTQKGFIQKFNTNLLAQKSSATPITIPTYLNINYMNIASEDEATYYIQNGIWPWDDYITSYVNKLTSEHSDEDTEDKVKLFSQLNPNRQMYKIFGENTVPQSIILSSLNPAIGNGLVLPDKSNQILTCKLANKGTLQNPDGTNIVIPSSGFYPYITPSKNQNNSNGAYTLDNTIFESIPGFTFDASVCNICAIDKFDYLGQFDEQSTLCSFSLKTPEAYNVFTGSNLKSTPSQVSTS